MRLKPVLLLAFAIFCGLGTTVGYAQTFVQTGSLGGPRGTPSFLESPATVAFGPDGTLYVANPDAASGRPINVFSNDGKFIKSFGTYGSYPEGFTASSGGPYALAVTRSNQLVVCEPFSVKLFELDGTFVRALSPERSSKPFLYGIAQDSENNIWVSEAGENPKLTCYSLTGNLIRTISLSDVPVPWTIRMSPNGTLIVDDVINRRLVEVSITGERIQSISVPSSGNNQSSPLGGFAIDNDLKVYYVADPANERIEIVGYDGTNTGHVDVSANGQQVAPYYISFTKGQLYVSDMALNTVKVFLDVTPPVTTASIDGEAPLSTWYLKRPNLQLSASSRRGISGIKVRINNGSTVFTSPTWNTLLDDGVHSVHYLAVNNAGVEESQKEMMVRVDRTPPFTIARVEPSGLVVRLYPVDSTSGVLATHFSIDDGPIQAYVDGIQLLPGKRRIMFWSEDNAGNSEIVQVLEPSGTNNPVFDLASFRLGQSSALGGRTVSATVLITNVVSTPTTINLGSDNVNVVVPASITIDAGQTSKTFTIETKPVRAYTQTNITATLGTQTRTAQLDLLPPTARIRISPPVVSSESTAKATITLSGHAPLGGLVVELESDESAASVPSSITVAEGQKTATLNITTGKVTEETYAYITATIDGVSTEASLTIRPKSIKPTTLSITESLVGGANGSGTITLSDPAPEGGLDVDLATNNAAVSLPLVVKIEAGSKTANFTFSTSAVSSTITATVSAKANGATVTDTIEVRVRPLGTLVASPSTLPGKATGTLTLTLSSPSAIPLTVNVTSSNVAVVLASKTITIAKGKSSGILKFTTALVGTDTTSTITCLSNGLEAKTDITVRSAKPSNVSLLPAVVLGGKGSVGTVTIDSAAPTSGLTVALSSSDSSAVVPSFVLVPSGKTTATFTITTSKVTSSKNVTITALANGVSKTATLGVRILTIASISFNPVSVEGGVKANGLLTLTDVAPLGGMTVTLSSDKAGVTVPTTLLVPAGKSTAAFVATTSVIGSSYDAKITGTANGETGSGTLKVLAPAVSSFALSKGGDKPLGTVKIAKASSVDVVVSLSSSNAAVASLPATVTIPRGQLLATFQVTTSKPNTATSVTLLATTGGLAKTVVLKVNP